MTGSRIGLTASRGGCRWLIRRYVSVRSAPLRESGCPTTFRLRPLAPASGFLGPGQRPGGSGPSRLVATLWSPQPALMTTARHRAVHRAVALPSNWRAVTHCRASWSRSVMPQASSRSWSASCAGAGADRPRREGVGGGGVSVRISGLGRRTAARGSGWFGGSRRSAATPIGGRHPTRRGGAHVVPVGQELLTAAAVLDADDVGFGELAHRSVDGVDRAAKAPGQGLPGRHPAT
jgi:hypothetical protein